jgi:hypothetical protein
VLIWRRFRQNRLALISGIFLLAVYLACPSPASSPPYPAERNAEALFMPPQTVGLFRAGHLAVTYPMTVSLDMETFQPVYVEDRTIRSPVRFCALRPAALWCCSCSDTDCAGLPARGRTCTSSAPTGWAATSTAGSCTARSCR